MGENNWSLSHDDMSLSLNLGYKMTLIVWLVSQNIYPRRLCNDIALYLYSDEGKWQ